MTAHVHFVNVGWGDAHFIQLPSGALTLIDGGDYASLHHADTPLAWMDRHQASKLDWMIVTHLHADHMIGMLDVAKTKEVVSAILPYEPFALPSKETVLAMGDETTEKVYLLLEAYLELIQLLQKQGTQILWRGELCSADSTIVWSQEGYTLRHLFPLAEDTLRAWPVLASALGSHTFDEEWFANFHHFFDLSNYDSSVYRLTCDEAQETCSVLFGGDQLEAGWVRLAQRTNIRSTIWKAPHHGLEDGFNQKTLELVQPERTIFTMDAEHAQQKMPYWESLGITKSADFHVTGDIASGETTCIWDGQIRVYMG